MVLNTMGPAAVYDSEADVIERARRGEQAACRTLFDGHREAAYRVAWRLVGHSEDALDVVQDSFMRAFQNLGGFAGASSFRTWLLRIVTRRAMDIRRSRRGRPAVSLDAGAADASRGVPDDRADADPGEPLARAELGEQLRQALDALPAEQRQAFILHADGGLTYAEIAAAQGVAVGTVMSRIYYARRRLRDTLQDLPDEGREMIRKAIYNEVKRVRNEQEAVRDPRKRLGLEAGKAIKKLAQAVALTPVQIEQAKEIASRHIERAVEAARVAKERNDPGYALNAEKEIKAEAEQDVIEILTPEQLDKLREMDPEGIGKRYPRGF